MIVATVIRQRYTEWESILQEIRRRVEDTIAPFARDRGFIFEGRIKTVESVAEKIESGRYRSWDDLDDLYACTIAVPVLADEEEVCSFVESCFDVVGMKRRGAIPKPPDSFRFDATRVICKLLRPHGQGVGREASIFSVPFEVQVKSLFDFAWAKTTHALTYKSSLVDWKRYRLAAHLKAAAEQADFLLLGFEKASELVPEGEWPDLEDKAKLRDLFHLLVEDSRIPREIQPKDWSRFVENLYRFIQVLEGRPPSGRGSEGLKSIDEAVRILRSYFRTTDGDHIPRSISLFQTAVGVLSSSGEFDGAREDYYLVAGPEYQALFPGMRLAGSEFAAG